MNRVLLVVWVGAMLLSGCRERDRTTDGAVEGVTVTGVMEGYAAKTTESAAKLPLSLRDLSTGLNFRRHINTESF